MWDFQLVPPSASSMSPEIDWLFYALVLLGGGVAVAIAVLLVFLSIKYRQGSKADRSPETFKGWKLEAAWIIIPLVIFMGLFAWSAVVYFKIYTPPADTLDIYVVGKRWMWKIQHPGGQREINELHVPVDRNVKLIIQSQDVIHSFFVPAFRIKRDAVPGRTTTAWFRPTRIGQYHLFCAEYCGTEHSRMTGTVYVMAPADYERWLSAGAPQEPASVPGTPAAPVASMRAAGEGVYFRLGCNSCHLPDSALRAPRLEGSYGHMTVLRNGQTVRADEAYLRESILDPNAKIVAGYPSPSLMPTYRGQVTEDQLNELIEYLKSLTPGAETQP